MESCSALRSAIREAREASVAAAAMLQLDAPPPVRLHIQSPGGSLLATWSVIDEVTRQHAVPVDSYIEGFAASAATLISVSCRRRYAGKNSVMLLHQLSAGSEGKLTQMKDTMANLDLFDRKMQHIYLAHTKLSSGKLQEILQHDLWLDSDDCLRFGLIDSVCD